MYGLSNDMDPSIDIKYLIKRLRMKLVAHIHFTIQAFLW